MAKTSGQLTGIQILRGIAATMVVLHHSLEESLFSKTSPTSPDWFTTFGAAGVDIFFVISGFIMLYVSYPPGRSAESARSFLVKRATRIYPFYWCCACVVLISARYGLYSSLHVGPGEIARSLLLFPSSPALVGVSWTLTFEIYFYVIFASTLPFRSRHWSALITATAIVAIFAIGHVLPDGELKKVLVNPIAIEFCFGLLLAYAALTSRLPERLFRYGWPLAFGVICIAPLVIHHESTSGLPPGARVAVWGIPAFLIVGSFLAVRGKESLLRSCALRMGDASYAIYLTHPFVMTIYARLMKTFPQFGDLPQLPFVPIVVTLAVISGFLAHIVIELPITNALRRTLLYRNVTRAADLRREPATG